MFSHVCSFGTSGQHNIKDLQGKHGASSRAGCPWQSMSFSSRIATECLHEPQDPALWWYSLFWSCSRDSSINTCFRRNAHSLQNPPVLQPQPLWSTELTSPCTSPVFPGLVSINTAPAEPAPASPASKSSMSKCQGSHSPSLLPVLVFPVMQGTLTALQAQGICSPSKAEA